MGRPIRIQDRDFIFHITNRTEQAMFLFVPDDELNEIAHYWMRRAIMMHDAEVYVAVLMSNHPHIIARFPAMNMHRFMCYLQRNLAREVNVLRGRYEATVFPRRYAAEPILDRASLLRMLGYVLCNPVAANLVARPEQWPGLTTYRQNAGLEEPHPLPLTTPPCWRGLAPDDVAAHFVALVEPLVKEHARARRWPVKGATRVKTQKWWKRPTQPKRGGRAYLHAASKLIRWHGANFLDRVQTRHHIASLARRARIEARFPYGTIAPGDVECSTDEPHRRPARHLLGALLGDADNEK